MDVDFAMNIALGSLTLVVAFALIWFRNPISGWMVRYCRPSNFRLIPPTGMLYVFAVGLVVIGISWILYG